MNDRGLKSKTNLPCNMYWNVVNMNFKMQQRKLFSCEQVALICLSQQIPDEATKEGTGKSLAKDRFYSADLSGQQKAFTQSCLSWRSFISQTTGLFIVCLGDSSRVRILTSTANSLGCRAELLEQESASKMLDVRLTSEKSCYFCQPNPANELCLMVPGVWHGPSGL